MDYTGYSNYRFTENMALLVQNRMASLNSMYCREDYERALRAVKRAPKDAYEFRMKDLEDMCKGNDSLTADALLVDKSLLESIPTRQELLDKLVDVIHDIHLDFPNPADYIKRIVHNLAPDYRGDTVRLAILKQFIKGAGFHCKEYKIKAIADWAIARMSASERKDYKSSSETEKINMLLRQLDDSIFSKEHLQPELTATETLGILVRRMESCATDLDLRDDDDNMIQFPGVKLSKETEKLLFDYCVTIKVGLEESPDLLSLLREMLEVILEDRSDNAELEALVEALKTDLVEQMRSLLYKDKNGKNTSVVRGLYKYDVRDRENALVKPWELLRVCDELASGNFKMNGATRVNLYHFAIMFKMTVALRDTDEFDADTNIVKNLFEDFYNDNLVRYLKDGFEDARYSSRFEREPTGEGINFKNYVEAIYLYYLCRNDLRLTPGERIDKSVQLIKSCVKEATSRKKAGTLPTEPYSDYTDIYKDLYVSQMVDLNEDQLLDFVLSYFWVLPKEKGDNGVGILMSSEESTAYDSVQEIMMDLDSAYSAANNASLVIATDDYGTAVDMEQFIEDAKFESKLLFDWKLAELLREKYSDDTGFVRVINNIDERLIAEFNWIGSRKKKFLANLLHLLCKDSSKDSPLMIDVVTEALKKTDVTINGAIVLDGIDRLAETGFDVQRETDKKTGRSLLWIDNRLYDDNALNEAVERASGTYWFDESSVLKRIDEILGQRLKINKRISRTSLIAVFTAYYVSLLEDTEGIESFHDLYEDFTSTLNYYLEKCRYQAISEKNILDMYVLISLYYYMVENGR